MKISRKQLRLGVGVFGIIALCGGAMWVYKHMQQQNREIQEVGASVAVFYAHKTPVTQQITVDGFMTGSRVVSIAPAVPGRVVRLVHRDGDHVMAGDVIAILESRITAATVEAARASTEAMTRVAAVQDAYGKKVAEQAKTNVARMEDAHDSDAEATTKKDITFAQQGASAARRMRDLQNAVAEAQRRDAEGMMHIAAATSGELIVRAPFAGVITMRMIEEGAVVQAGTPLVTIVDTQAMTVVADVAYAVGRSITQGQSVVMEREDARNVVCSVTRRAMDANEQTHDTRITFTCPSADATWLGAYIHGTLRIAPDVAREAWRVPAETVLQRYDDRYLLVSRDGVSVALPVKVVGNDGTDLFVEGDVDHVEIIRMPLGHREGERITTVLAQ